MITPELVAAREAGHCLAALQLGVPVLYVDAGATSRPHCRADLDALDPLDLAAFDVAGHFAQVITGLGSPALEALDLAGMGDDGAQLAYMLGYTRAPLTVVLARAEELLTSAPGALADLAALLATRRSLDRLTVARWWRQARPDNDLGIRSP